MAGVSFFSLVILPITFSLYFVGLAVYRLYFHPLSKIPGPKFAALTRWYECYYDVLCWPGGKYMHIVNRLHDTHGPVVRVGPSEVHIKDRDYVETLFCSASVGTRHKFEPAARITGTPLGIFGTVDHTMHKNRRAAVSSFFSKKAADDIEPLIHEKANVACEVLKRQTNRDGKTDLRTVYLAFFTDIICSHAFNRPLDLLQNEREAKRWREAISALAMLTPLVRQFPWLIPTAIKLPIPFWNLIYPALGRVVQLHREAGEKSITRAEDMTLTKRPALFRTILSSNLPIEEKSLGRLSHESLVFVGAGGETCARHMTNATYYILANQDRVLPRLRKELDSVMPSADTMVSSYDLQKLPWLNSIIRETLRVTALVTSRLPLVAPEPLSHPGSGYTIPSGYAVSMTLRDILRDPAIYPAPNEFRPERWLESSPAELEKMNKFYLPFSRGSRACMGIYLAYAQLHILIATVFRRLELELEDVLFERDIESNRDCFVGETSIHSAGVFVKAMERTV
ncbi:cytochrome P450 [Viridothelium virens]|uniref:Cytochrome P450 n=1 Tax=Viridothelium virens TaxID=1048519 RepID=A0A6A6HBQ2_VIRVR|nr:cytochrome P450 [Viridothelium virens]